MSSVGWGGGVKLFMWLSLTPVSCISDADSYDSKILTS